MDLSKVVDVIRDELVGVCHRDEAGDDAYTIGHLDKDDAMDLARALEKAGLLADN